MNRLKKGKIVSVNIPLLFCVFVVLCLNTSCASVNKRAKSTLEIIQKNYGIAGSELLRETFPFDENHKATYLVDTEQANLPNQYSYLWPFSGYLTAAGVLIENTKTNKYKKLLDEHVLQGLNSYYDTRRLPPAYASYINTAPLSGRFYDDNVWIGIDFTDLYLHTGEKQYLNKAVEVWQFIESGTDSILGGGIYWCEQKKRSKHTCSNAPGAVYALKLFEATKDSAYFHKGAKLYEWTKQNLQDPNDFLYYDNINVNGNVDKAKFAYNSGQMMQAAALLYNFTQKAEYLKDAQNIAKSAYEHFFNEFTNEKGETFRLPNKGNVWFTAVMSRGYIELYHLDKDKRYIDSFKKSLDYAWEHMRDENGLFNTDWSGKTKDKSKWLLTQFAMVEMYARITKL